MYDIYTSVSVVLCFLSGWDIGIHIFSVRYISVVGPACNQLFLYFFIKRAT